MSPVALRAVVGTKADLLDSREVSTEEALVSGQCVGGERRGKEGRGGGRRGEGRRGGEREGGEGRGKEGTGGGRRGEEGEGGEGRGKEGRVCTRDYTNIVFCTTVVGIFRSFVYICACFFLPPVFLSEEQRQCSTSSLL